MQLIPDVRRHGDVVVKFHGVTLPVAIAVFGSLGADELKAQELDRRIPAAIVDAYEEIRDAQEWRNPAVVIRREGIEVVSDAILGGRVTVTADSLSRVLAELPVGAWPYGRVVIATDIGIRDGNGSDEEPIRRNHEAAQVILGDLNIEVNWWAS